MKALGPESAFQAAGCRRRTKPKIGDRFRMIVDDCITNALISQERRRRKRLPESLPALPQKFRGRPPSRAFTSLHIYYKCVVLNLRRKNFRVSHFRHVRREGIRLPCRISKHNSAESRRPSSPRPTEISFRLFIISVFQPRKFCTALEILTGFRLFSTLRLVNLTIPKIWAMIAVSTCRCRIDGIADYRLIGAFQYEEV